MPFGRLAAELQKKTGEVSALKQELQDLCGVIGDSELAQRLLLVAPVLAAKTDGRKITGVQVAGRNASSHSLEAPAHRLATATPAGAEQDPVRRLDIGGEAPRGRG